MKPPEHSAPGPVIDAVDHTFEVLPLFELSKPLEVTPDFTGLGGGLLEGTIGSRPGPPIALDSSPSQGRDGEGEGARSGL
eukprot:3787869-Heterocapsa_arctica.AAC.1